MNPPSSTLGSTRRRFRIAPLLLAPVLAFTGRPHATAATETWNGADSTWETATNWTPQTVPNNNTFQTLFGAAGSTTVNLTAAETVNTVTFGAGAQAYNFTGLGLTLDVNSAATAATPVLTNSSATAQSFTNAVTFSNSQTFGANGVAVVATTSATGTLSFNTVTVNGFAAAATSPSVVFAGPGAVNIAGSLGVGTGTGAGNIQLGVSGNTSATLNLSGNGTTIGATGSFVSEQGGGSLGNTVTIASTYVGTTTNTVAGAFQFNSSGSANTIHNFNAAAGNTLVFSASLGNSGSQGGQTTETLNINNGMGTTGTVRIAANTNYVVPTTVVAGMLQIGTPVNGATAAVAANLRIGVSSVTVNNGATLGFAGTSSFGTGATSGAITVNAGGNLSLADGGIYTASLNSNATVKTTALTLTNASFTFDINGSTADKLNGTNANVAIALNGNITVNLNALGTVNAGTYTLISTGTAGNLGVPTSFVVGTAVPGFNESFTDNGQNLTVTLTAVPEPGTWTAMFVVAGGWVTYFLRRRHSRRA